MWLGCYPNRLLICAADTDVFHVLSAMVCKWEFFFLGWRYGHGVELWMLSLFNIRIGRSMGEWHFNADWGGFIVSSPRLSLQIGWDGAY